jgi:hypothetical protein
MAVMAVIITRIIVLRLYLLKHVKMVSYLFLWILTALWTAEVNYHAAREITKL